MAWNSCEDAPKWKWYGEKYKYKNTKIQIQCEDAPKWKWSGELVRRADKGHFTRLRFRNTERKIQTCKYKNTYKYKRFHELVSQFLSDTNHAMMWDKQNRFSKQWTPQESKIPKGRHTNTVTYISSVLRPTVPQFHAYKLFILPFFLLLSLKILSESRATFANKIVQVLS